MFYNCSELEFLPKKLRENEPSETEIADGHTLKLNALFANCSKLRGYKIVNEDETTEILNYLPGTFFDNLKPYITELGDIKFQDSFEGYAESNYALGAFANTSISYYDIDTFQNLKELTNINGLFAQAEIKTETKDSIKHYFLKEKEGKCFKGYYSGDETIKTLSANMFKGCSSIKNIEGAFMGTDIENIEEVEETAECFLGGATDITSIAALFANSSLENCKGLNQFINHFSSSISNASYAFSNTNIEDTTFISELSQLINATGIFSKCASINTLPMDLFQNSKNTLEDISYAFA
jgi:hypothetical protein